jgi:hypothetical protein
MVGRPRRYKGSVRGRRWIGQAYHGEGRPHPRPLGAAPTPHRPPGDHGHASRSPSLPPLACSLPCVVTFVCMQLAASLWSIRSLVIPIPATTTHACTPTDDDDVPIFISCARCSMECTSHASMQAVSAPSADPWKKAATRAQWRTKVQCHSHRDMACSILLLCVSSPHVKVKGKVSFSTSNSHWSSIFNLQLWNRVTDVL